MKSLPQHVFSFLLAIIIWMSNIITVTQTFRDKINSPKPYFFVKGFNIHIPHIHNYNKNSKICKNIICDTLLH